jgi:hypothetical protein
VKLRARFFIMMTFVLLAAQLASAGSCLVGRIRRRLDFGPPPASLDVETTDPSVFLDPSRFEEIYKIRKQRGEHESTITLNSFEAARNYVQKFPALKTDGFDPQDYSGWTKVYCRLTHSSFFGKFVGWEKKLSNGDFARYRYDYEPDVVDPKSGKVIHTGMGGHWNIEVSIHNAKGKRETSKLAVQFLCSDGVCTEQQAQNYLARMNR